MAKSISEEELQLRKRARRRLIGAIALVTIVAVFLPMALDHEPKPVNQDISIRIPPSTTSAFAPKPAPAPEPKPVVKPAPVTPVQPALPVAGDAPKAAAAPATATEAAPPKQAAVAQPKAQAKPVAKSAAKSAPETKAAERAQPAPQSAGGYVVQVAALNDADKAIQMQQQIAAAGVKSYTEVVPVVNGQVTRVRAGPFASRDEAEKIRDRLKGMGLSGNVVAK